MIFIGGQRYKKKANYKYFYKMISLLGKYLYLCAQNLKIAETMKTKLTTLVLLTLAALCASAQPLRQDAAIRTGKLKNGLTYYIRHNAKEAGLADFYIAQKVGSIQEEPRQRGLAHFLEHMAFNGTKNFPGKGKRLGIVPWCETIGVKFGANLNGYWSYVIWHELDDDTDFDTDYCKMVEAMTAEQVQRMAQTILNARRCIEVTMLSE